MMVTQPAVQPAPAAPSSPSREMTSVRSRWQQHLPSLILLALVIAIYAGVLVKLVHDWYTDPDFSHGFLVPLFSAYLLWTKRRALRSTPVRQSWGGVPLVVLAII